MCEFMGVSLLVPYFPVLMSSVVMSRAFLSWGVVPTAPICLCRKDLLQNMINVDAQTLNPSLTSPDDISKEMPSTVQTVYFFAVVSVQLRREILDQEVLGRRVGEHASRLQRQEAGLKTHIEAIQRLQADEKKLSISHGLISREKDTLLSRAGLDVSAGPTSGEGGGDSEKGDELGEERAQAVMLEKGKEAAELEGEKDRLQARCRELQVNRVVRQIRSI